MKDTTYLNPTDTVKAPSEDAIKVRLPFVGIYNTILDGDISAAIERLEEYQNFDRAEVDLKSIYRSIYDATVKVLNLKCTYGGITSPEYYNYDDDGIYAYIEKDYFEELQRQNPDCDGTPENIIYALCIKADEEQEIDADNHDFYGYALAIYDKWVDGIIRGVHYNGYEVISDNIKVY